MADLRGEQLKDSYQNVVTRGTGNKLENGNGVEFADLDDKASLSDVTEADSNSNGNFKKTYLTEHTGIMECWHQLSVSRTIEVTRSFAGGFRNVGDAGLWTFPQEFSSTPRIWHHLRRGEALPTRGGTINTSFSELQIWRPDSVTTSFDLIWWVRAIGPFDDTPE